MYTWIGSHPSTYYRCRLVCCSSRVVLSCGSRNVICISFSFCFEISMVERKYIPHWCKVKAVHQIELLPMRVWGSCPLCLLVLTLTFACGCTCICLCLCLLTLTIALWTCLCPSCLLAFLLPSYLFMPLTHHLFILYFMSISWSTCTLTIVNISIIFLEDISPFHGATYAPVLNFWWCLLWVLKPELAAIYMLGGGICVIHSLRFTSTVTPPNLLVTSTAAEPFSSTCIPVSRHWWGLTPGPIMPPLNLWDQAGALLTHLCWLSYFDEFLRFACNHHIRYYFCEMIVIGVAALCFD